MEVLSLGGSGAGMLIEAWMNKKVKCFSFFQLPLFEFYSCYSHLMLNLSETRGIFLIRCLIYEETEHDLSSNEVYDELHRI